MHSHAVPAEELEASGCFTILPVRRSNIWKVLEDVASSTQRDWRQKVGDDTPSDSTGRRTQSLDHGTLSFYQDPFPNA